MAKKKEAPKRAPKGELGLKQVLVYLPEDLHDQVKRSADRNAVYVSEWFRRAAQEKLDRE